MLPTSFQVCVLQTVITALRLSDTWAFDQVRQPIGPIMCREHCRQFTHCTNCVFLVESLVCKATWPLYPVQAHGEGTEYLDINEDGGGAYFSGLAQCPDRYSRILRTRTSNYRCLKLRRDTMTRLLVAPLQKNEETPFIEMQLDTNSTEQHPYLQASSVNAIAYVPSTHRVLIALHAKRYIQSCSLDKNDCVTVRDQTRARYIEVDDALDLVFLTTVSPQFRISRMTPEGRYFKYITTDVAYPSAICLDTTQRIVYVSCIRNIKLYSYDGEVREVTSFLQRPYALALDEDALYVAFTRTVKYMSVSTGSGLNTLTYIKHNPYNVLHYGEQLYVSYTPVGPDIISVFNHNRWSKRKMKAGGKQGNVMTLIP